MTVLSDKTIREAIQRNELVTGAELHRAKHCAYEFRPGRVVYGGVTPDQTIRAVDFSGKQVESTLIGPSAVVWVRSRERVKIPSDKVGLWIQTNSLSRRGLLLLNSTLVEPGYEGYLSAHLVNLGSQPVVLAPDDTIAKLVFFTLDIPSTDLVDPAKYANYDAFLDTLAAASAATFLRISELLPDLKRQVDGLLDEELRRGLERLQTDTKEIVAKAKEQLVAAEGATFRKIGGGFVTGFVLALAFMFWAFPFLRGVDAESEARIRDVVKKENETIVRQIQQLRLPDAQPISPAPPVP